MNLIQQVRHEYNHDRALQRLIYARANGDPDSIAEAERTVMAIEKQSRESSGYDAVAAAIERGFAVVAGIGIAIVAWIVGLGLWKQWELLFQ